MDGRRRPEPEGLPICLDALALGHEAPKLQLRIVEFAAALVDNGKQPINLPQLIRQISEALPQLHLFLPGLDVVHLRPLLGVRGGVLEGLDHHGPGHLDRIQRFLDHATGGLDGCATP